MNSSRGRRFLAVEISLVLGLAVGLAFLLRAELLRAEADAMTDTVEHARARFLDTNSEPALAPGEAGFDLVPFEGTRTASASRYGDLDEEAHRALSHGKTSYVAAASDEVLLGYGRIDDNYLRPAYLLRIVRRRPVWAHRDEIIWSGVAALILAALGLGGLSTLRRTPPIQPPPQPRTPSPRRGSSIGTARLQMPPRADEEWIELLELAIRDPAALRAAFAEASRLVNELLAGTTTELSVERAALGSLATNMITRSTSKFLGVCLDLEARLGQSGAPLTPEDRAAVGAAWTIVAEPLRHALEAAADSENAGSSPARPSRSSTD
ncbi:MAG: hypothetical protein U1E65_30920 [Myxococcota bacterium]